MSTLESNMEKEKEKEVELRINPHLALTHVAQGGAANKRNVALLLKAQDELSDENKELLKSLLGGDTVEGVSKQYNTPNTVRSIEHALRSAASKEFGVSFPIIIDWDASGVIIWSESADVGGFELYYFDYTIGEEGLTLSNKTSVEEFITRDYRGENGEIKLSSSENSLLVKSVAIINSDKELLKAINFEKKGEDSVELQQALTELEKSKNDLKEALQEVELLKSQVAEFEAQKQQAEVARRKDMLKAVLADEDKVEELLKSLEALEPAAFDTVVKAMEVKDQAVQESDLCKQMSQTTGDGGGVDELEDLEKLLKAQYENK